MFVSLGGGVSLGNMFNSVTDWDEPMGFILVFLIFDTLLYGFLAYYLDAVFPGQYGMAKPWYFFCTVNFNYYLVTILILDQSKLGKIVNSFTTGKLKFKPLNLFKGSRTETLIQGMLQLFCQIINFFEVHFQII